VDFQNHTIGHPYHRHFQLFAGGGTSKLALCGAHRGLSGDSAPACCPTAASWAGEEACIVLAIYMEACSLLGRTSGSSIDD
jgi:hypothetical protein